ncbi:MAG: hydrogenase iron-sulfur subunit [Chloroflexota bacterium]
MKPSWKNLLPQADPEKDCLPPVIEDEEEHDADAEWQAVRAQGAALASWPWPARPGISGRVALVWIEKIALALESVVNRLIGGGIERLNPFYHTGTIAVFLLVVVAVTGLYLTVFYIAPGLGTKAAYGAVAAIDNHWLWLGRIMRGAHRYASGAAVIATLLHALRTLFQDRFRGARWLAWVTGMLLLAALWFEGLTGYWLVWDERAQLILETVIRAVNTFPSVGVPFTLNFLTNEATDQTWVFFLLLLFAHMALFTVLGVFYWFHILRLNRAKLLPSRYFMIALSLILIGVALARPATSALQADLGKLPGQLTFDPFFLFYLPATLRVNPAFFWGGVLVVFALVTAIPWLFQGKQPGKVVIDKDLCTGCTKCAEDCPYNAIAMLPRSDGKPHKLIAIENPNLCVSCGICVGSCDGMAVSLTDLPATDYYRSILARVHAARLSAGGPVSVVFTCERHGAHGAAGASSSPARPDAHHDGALGAAGAEKTEVITVPCVGALHPNVVGQALEAGAAEVAVVGCPADDCAQREGNLWLQARLNRTRAPRLKRAYLESPIRTAFLPPDEFALALSPRSGPGQAAKEKESQPLAIKPWHWIRGGLLLAAALALQVAFTDIQYQPYRPDESLLQLGMRNNSQWRQNTQQLTGPELAALPPEEQARYLGQQQAEGRFPTRLRLEVDGQVLLDQTYLALGLHNEGSSFAYGKFILAPGEHAIRLSMDDSGGELQTVIEQTVNFAPGQIHAITFDRVMDTFELK